MLTAPLPHQGSPLPHPHQGSVRAVAFSSDGGTVLTGSWDHTARLWDARTGKPLTPPLQHQDSIQTLAFEPNGKGLFVATDHWLNTYSWDGQKAKFDEQMRLVPR